MGALGLIHLSPWPVAAAFAALSSVLSAFAAVEVRRGAAVNRGMLGMLGASFLTLLSLHELSPAMITAIGGIGMIIVIVGGCHDNPSCIERFSGTLMVLSVVLIAVDIGVNAGPPTPAVPDADMQGFFWSVVVVSAFVTGACSYVEDSSFCRIYLAIGTGIQAVCSLGMAYVVMAGNAGFIPLMLFSALLEMLFMRLSLAVNQLYVHLPIWYAVWQGGVWTMSPFMTELEYHGTSLTVAGSAVTMLAALLILWVNVNPACSLRVW